MPLDHVSIPVSEGDFEPIVTFYTEALAPIKYEKLMEFPGAVGFGVKPSTPDEPMSPDFWITTKDSAPETNGFHAAFKAEDHETVDAFHASAVKAGGTSNGEPGIRAWYHPHYYGAFVIDPLGNNIEVVDHCPH